MSVHSLSSKRASDMIVFDESGATLEGEGVVELSAQCIHAPIHRITGAPLEVLSDAIVTQVQAPPADDRHSRSERERLYFEAMMRVLDREMPGYAD